MTEYNKRKQEALDNLTDDQKTDMVWKGEEVYWIGKGHSFLLGSFKHYLTKSGIELKCFLRNSEWSIDNEIGNYRYEEGNWVKIERHKPKEANKDSFSSVVFPTIKRKFT